MINPDEYNAIKFAYMSESGFQPKFICCIRDIQATLLLDSHRLSITSALFK